MEGLCAKWYGMGERYMDNIGYNFVFENLFSWLKKVFGLLFFIQLSSTAILANCLYSVEYIYAHPAYQQPCGIFLK